MSYSSEVYKEALRVMENRRTEAEMKLERRREILYARSPRAEEIERKIAHTSVAAAKAILVNGEDLRTKLEELKQRNLTLQKELKDIIASFDFGENYLEPWYKCQKCHDRGDVDGKTCECMKSLLRQIAYDQLNSCSPLSLSDFDSFSLDYYSKIPTAEGRPSANAHMTAVLGFCKKYARNFEEDADSLLFQGGPGLGKTHLSLAIANELIQKGFGVIYVSAPNILARLAKENFEFEYRFGEQNSTEQLLIECDLLILDDLGIERTSRNTLSILYNLLNSRMLLSKPTIVSTNLRMEHIQEQYDFRIVSRIIGNLRRVEFVGTDIRQLKRKKKKLRNDEYYDE